MSEEVRRLFQISLHCIVIYGVFLLKRHQTFVQVDFVLWNRLMRPSVPEPSHSPALFVLLRSKRHWQHCSLWCYVLLGAESYLTLLIDDAKRNRTEGRLEGNPISEGHGTLLVYICLCFIYLASETAALWMFVLWGSSSGAFCFNFIMSWWGERWRQSEEGA